MCSPEFFGQDLNLPCMSDAQIGALCERPRLRCWARIVEGNGNLI